MKIKALAFTLLSLSALHCFAQDSLYVGNSKTQTWFSGSKHHSKLHYFGMYLSPEVQYGSLAGNYTPISGMSAMLLFNKKWALGLAGYGTMSEFTPSKLSSTKALEYRAQYGGLKLEFTPKPNAVVHVSFPLLIGAGMANIDSVDSNNSYGKGRGRNGKGGRFDDGFEGGRERNEDAFFILQPGINLETNVLRVAKVFVGANYRIAAGKSNSTIANTALIPTSNQLSGLSLSFGAKVGIFAFDVQRKRRMPHLRTNRGGHRRHKQN